MKNVNLSAKLCLAYLGFFSQPVFSQLNNHHKSYIDIGIVGGVQHHDSPLAGVYGSFGTFFMAFGKPASIDVRVKELHLKSRSARHFNYLNLPYAGD